MIRITLITLFYSIAVPSHAAVDIQEVTSAGGVEAWLVEEHSIPFAPRLPFGSSDDPPLKRISSAANGIECSSTNQASTPPGEVTS